MSRPMRCPAAVHSLRGRRPRVWTAAELFTRNVGTTEQQNKQMPPHKIIGNVYYVGTESLGKLSGHYAATATS